MLKDTKANKIFLIILVILLALSFSLFKGWERRGITQRGEQIIAFNEGDSLSVSTISNDIIISVDEQAKEATISLGSHDDEELEVSKHGSSLSVTVRPIKRWFLRFFSYTASPLVVTLPSGNLARLEVSSTSGNITLMHPMQATDLKIRGVSSEVDFLTLQVADQLEIGTTSGDISGKEVSSRGEVTISSTSGGVEIQRITGPKTILRSVSSEVEAGIILSTGNSIEAKTTSGEIELDLRSSDDLQVTATTVNGSIEFNDQKQEGSEATIKMGDGSNTIQLSSVSGAIDVLY